MCIAIKKATFAKCQRAAGPRAKASYRYQDKLIVDLSEVKKPETRALISFPVWQDSIKLDDTMDVEQGHNDVPTLVEIEVNDESAPMVFDEEDSIFTMNTDWHEPAPMEIDWHEPAPMEIDWFEQVPMEIDWYEPAPMETDWFEPVPMEIDWYEPVPMQID